jgi:competence protein ComEC
MRYPLIRILFPFCFGIWLSIHFPLEVSFWVLLLLFAISIFIYQINKTKPEFQLRYKWITGVWIYFITAFTGYWICNQSQTIFQNQDFSKTISSSSGFLVKLEDNPIEKNSISHSSAKILFSYGGNSWKQPCSDIMLFFKDANVKYGDILFIKNELQQVQPRNFPFDFNYKKYLQRQNIFYSAFLNPSQFISLRNQGNAVYAFSYKKRNQLLQFIQTSFTDPQVAPVAESLIAGYQNDMDARQRAQFVNTGTVHILAVSGLRIGILLSVIGLFLFPLKKRFSKSARAIAITLIWLYVIATGCTGAGIRVAVFLSLLTGAQFLRRTPQPLNLLACAAFLILFFNPLVFSDVGFQLSIAAVAGIILFQKEISSLVSPPNSIVKYLADLIAITCAAQIFLLPLQLYYFHLFPSYSIISNVMVVPMVFLITYAAFGMLIFSWLPVVSNGFIFLISFFIKCINNVVSFFNHLPLAALSFSQLSRGEVLVLFLLVFSFSFFLFTKNKEFIFMFLTSALFFISLQIIDDFKIQKRNQIEIYAFDKYPMLQITSGSQAFIFGDSNRIHADKLYDWIAFERNHSINSVTFVSWQKVLSDSLEKINNFPLAIGRNRILCQNHNFLFSFNKNEAEPSSVLGNFSMKKSNGKLNFIQLKQVSFWQIKNSRDTLFLHRNDYVNLQSE